MYKLKKKKKKTLIMEIGDILEDGSMYGKTFSGDNYKGEYPSPKENETYKEYRERVQKCKEEGFHLGDLSWSDWHSYNVGAGYDDEHSKNDVIC